MANAMWPDPQIDLGSQFGQELVKAIWMDRGYSLAVAAAEGMSESLEA